MSALFLRDVLKLNKMETRMKRLTITALVFLTLQLTAAPQEQPKKASVEGTITRSDNGQPIAGAQVTLNRINTGPVGPGTAGGGGIVGGIIGGVGGGSIASSSSGGNTSSVSVGTGVALPPSGAVGTPQNPALTQIAPATTDSDGRFTFNNLDPGTYRMIANATGYVRQEYTSRPITTTVGNGTPFPLTDGQAMKNAGIRLTPTGTISGRIIDDTGQPAIGVPVLALQYTYDTQGLKILRQVGTDSANDRGEYRIYGLAPGRYYVAMGNGPGPLRGPRGGLGQISGVSYAFHFYPGVSDVAQASTIELKTGGEASADFKAVRQPMRAVRGRVTDSTGQMIVNPTPTAGARGQNPVSIALAYSGFGSSGSFSSGNSYNPATGNFEILNVIPGAYTVQAQMQDNTPTNAANIQDRIATQQSRPMAEASIVVGNADVENIVLTFTTPATVPGKISVEGIAGQDSTGSPIEQVRVQFRRLMNGAVYNIGNAPAASTTGADGKFQVAGMRPGEYAMNFFGVPPAYYVKSVQFDDKEVLGKSIEFSGSSNSGFSVVLSSKAGQVQGMVTDEKMQPAAGAMAVLIPSGSDDRRSRLDLYKSAMSNEKGQFTFIGITPGDYKLFAWDGMEQNRYFDPEFLKTYEAKGKTVHVGESAKIAADVQVIAVQPE